MGRISIGLASGWRKTQICTFKWKKAHSCLLRRGARGDMEEAEVLELYELHYSDLMLLSSTITPSSLSLAEEERESLKLISRDIMEALGPTGPGLLSISGVPDASTLRRDLLPFARRLALLNPDDRKSILKVLSEFDHVFFLFLFLYVHVRVIFNTLFILGFVFLNSFGLNVFGSRANAGKKTDLVLVLFICLG